MAFYDDWVAWYLYLVECLHQRPLVSELSQSARVFPFFAAIGRHIEIAKKIEGIEAKLSEFLNSKVNQPDSTLFELVVAIMYARNGYNVEFIPETALHKTPDLSVTKGEERFFVECKRLAKITNYSEAERQEWRKRWFNLVPSLINNKKSVFIDIAFKVELKDTSEYVLVKAFNAMKSKISKDNILRFESDEVAMKIRQIDLKKVNNHFDNFYVKWNSGQMISLLADGFDSSENYTHLCTPKNLVRIGGDENNDILNIFCTGVKSAFCARWECIAEESIEKKAKDIKTHLSKAIRQVPDGEPTVVHISYETLHGPVIEFKRARKIAESIDSFDCGGKDIRAIYCHAIQPSISEEDWEIAETTLRFGKNGYEPTSILSHDLLLDEEGTIISPDTHWNEDFRAMLKI
ncbi:TPA: hypothetical protein MYQ22_004543 [Serratia marcescens]|nr:hypothetical protein [Serratia marcescens]HAU5757701.1 hypothetical protein [Serratia marcescens]HAU5766853.1 hypothetical protein [Serratia marcescens]HCB1447361.1 hypothetical protein [Serratia marcescens]HCB1484897.1 hypothetical protein [Serratia marcescens]